MAVGQVSSKSERGTRGSPEGSHGRARMGMGMSRGGRGLRSGPDPGRFPCVLSGQEARKLVSGGARKDERGTMMPFSLRLSVEIIGDTLDYR
jgi:hypothetical protein